MTGGEVDAHLAARQGADKTQVGGRHYADLKVQPWEALDAWLTPEQWRGYLLGTAIAYLARANHKHDVMLEDVEKAIHTAQKLAEVLKSQE